MNFTMLDIWWFMLKNLLFSALTLSTGDLDVDAPGWTNRLTERNSHCWTLLSPFRRKLWKALTMNLFSVVLARLLQTLATGGDWIWPRTWQQHNACTVYARNDSILPRHAWMTLSSVDQLPLLFPYGQGDYCSELIIISFRLSLVLRSVIFLFCPCSKLK